MRHVIGDEDEPNEKRLKTAKMAKKRLTPCKSANKWLKLAFNVLTRSPKLFLPGDDQLTTGKVWHEWLEEIKQKH